MNSETILILAPSLNDGKIAQAILKEAGLDALACPDATSVAQYIREGCGCLILAKESLVGDVARVIETAVYEQPTWSDLPVILLTTHENARKEERFAERGNTSLLERPFSKQTLVKAAQAALRARRRQYEVNALLTELTRSKELAVQANVTKTQFLANMSHEIRTPIGAIIGFSDLLRTANLPETERDRYTEIVSRNSHHLLRLIDDILDLSKVESGKITIENVDFDFPELLADLFSIMRFRASEKAIEFRIQLNSSIPKIICGDPVRLRQILSNVCGNAIKFTSEGFVELQATYQNENLFFTIEDTGLGLSQDQAKTLFDPFVQADTSTTRKFGGTGLGLTIARQLAQAMGGNVTLGSSVIGKGSVFNISVKVKVEPDVIFVGAESLEVRPSSEEAPAPKSSAEALRVLLVEDSPDNQILISRYLKKAGLSVTTASDGLEGYEQAIKGGFDLVLMDIQMPILDGHEATRRLRREGYTKPIVALTAHAMIEERKKGIESGFTEYLTKPVQAKTLVELLERLKSQI